MINATIPTSNFIYYLGDGTVTKTYTYINSSDLNFYYQFCATPNLTLHVDPYIQYKQGADYPQRIYDAEVLDYTNDTTDLTLYLLGTADGIYVTFQIINSADQVISGVEVTAIRTINGDDVQVGIGTTGADGGVTLWLNPDFSHDFTFTKSGFTTLETSFAPTQSAYTITLSGGVSATTGYDYSRGISYFIKPPDGELINNTIYNFNYTLFSSYWEVTEFGFSLKLRNGTILTSTNANTNGGIVGVDFNVSNYSSFLMNYYYVINSTYTNFTTHTWYVVDQTYTGWSIKTFFVDLTLYLDSGFFGIDDFGRDLIIFIVIFFTIGIFGYKFGFNNPLMVSAMIFAVVFFFDVVVKLIPTPINAIPHAPTFLSLLILITLAVREARR